MQERSIHDSGHPGAIVKDQRATSSPRDVPGPKARADLSAHGDGFGGARMRSDRDEDAFNDDVAEDLAAARLLGGLSTLASAWPVNRDCLPTPGEKRAKPLRPAKKRKNEDVSAARILVVLVTI